jgi:hypothetical protein
MGLLGRVKQLAGAAAHTLQDSLRAAGGALLLGVSPAAVWAQSPTLRQAFRSPADLAAAAFSLLHRELGALASPGLHLGQFLGEQLAAAAGPASLAAEAAPKAGLSRITAAPQLGAWYRLVPEFAKHGLLPGDLARALLAKAWNADAVLATLPEEAARAVARLWKQPGVARTVAGLAGERPQTAALLAGAGAAAVSDIPRAFALVGGSNGDAGSTPLPPPPPPPPAPAAAAPDTGMGTDTNVGTERTTPSAVPATPRDIPSAFAGTPPPTVTPSVTATAPDALSAWFRENQRALDQTIAAFNRYTAAQAARLGVTPRTVPWQAPAMAMPTTMGMGAVSSPSAWPSRAPAPAPGGTLASAPAFDASPPPVPAPPPLPPLFPGRAPTQEDFQRLATLMHLSALVNAAVVRDSWQRGQS